MKLLTLNTHSLEECEYEKKLAAFAKVVCQEQPQIMALQEVNQRIQAPPVKEEYLDWSGYIPCPLKEETELVVVRQDNHAFQLARRLREQGLEFWWTWIPAKIGYGRYDEGLAMFSLYPIVAADQFFISNIRDYQNWKTRRLLGIQAETPEGSQWFGCVHMGWWQDEEEPFKEQWDRLTAQIRQRWQRDETQNPVWLMGDFNARSDVRNEGYDYIRAGGWQDTYVLAEEKDSGITAGGRIDGWKDQKKADGMRIDYIWCSLCRPIRRSRVICSPQNGPVVSDHYAVVLEY